MITIIASNQDMKEEIIHDLMKIESEVYEEDMRGEYESIRARFLKYPEMFFIAYDEDKIVGYFCYFPIGQTMYEEIRYKGCFRDDDIQPEDILPLHEARHIYLLSVAIYKEYQDIGIADEMMKLFEAFVVQSKAQGYPIEDAIATIVTTDGEKLAKRYGYKMCIDKWQQEGFKVFYKEFTNE